jgi:hypothetical protein
MRGRSTLVFAALLSLVGTVAATEPDMRQVTVYDGLVSLDVPAGWHEIPPDVLEYYSLLAAEESGGQIAEIYQHGFRRGNPEIDFQPPQILVQIRESGRLNYRQFLHLPPVESLRRRSNHRLEDRSGPPVDDPRLNEVHFDRDRFALRVDNTLDLATEGTVLVKSLSFLTERGTFTIHGYTTITENVALRPVFEHIFDSVRIDPSIRYRPRMSDRTPPRSALVAYSIAAVLAVATAILYLVQRRRRPS